MILHLLPTILAWTLVAALAAWSSAGPVLGHVIGALLRILLHATLLAAESPLLILGFSLAVYRPRIE